MLSATAFALMLPLMRPQGEEIKISTYDCLMASLYNQLRTEGVNNDTMPYLLLPLLAGKSNMMTVSLKREGERLTGREEGPSSKSKESFTISDPSGGSTTISYDVEVECSKIDNTKNPPTCEMSIFVNVKWNRTDGDRNSYNCVFGDKAVYTDGEKKSFRMSWLKARFFRR